jgi:hypothetical protein
VPIFVTIPLANPDFFQGVLFLKQTALLYLPLMVISHPTSETSRMAVGS